MLYPPINSVFEEGFYKYVNNLFSTTFKYHLLQHGIIWWNSFVVMTWNVNIDERPILQFCEIAPWAVG